MSIKTRSPDIDNKVFIRHFRDDCAFERRAVWDEDLKCYMAQITEGPAAGTFDIWSVRPYEVGLAT